MRKIFLSIWVLLSLISTNTYSQNEQSNLVYNIKVFSDTGVMGNMTIELFPFVAPKQVTYFDSLVKIKFFDSTAFHRVVPGFVIQGGDPNSKTKPRSTWGQGDPSQENVEAEFSKINYVRGILGAARDADTNSANSQFFICVAAASHLNGKYTVYGRQTSNFELLDAIVSAPRDSVDNPLQKISTIITFIGTNDELPEKVKNNAPADGTSNVSISRILSFGKVNTAVLYEVEISEGSDFNTIHQKGMTGSTSFAASNLKPAKKYYWRVRANNGGRFGSFSDPYSFTTTGYTGIKNNVKKKNLIIQNPVQGNNLKINYTSENSLDINVQLIDIEGKTIYEQKNSGIKQGENILIAQLPKNLKGNYILRLGQGTNYQQEKLLLLGN